MPISVAPWLTATDFDADARLANVTLPPGVTYDMIAQGATDFLFEMSGERFPGVTTSTIRPHALYDQCASGLFNLGTTNGSSIGGRVFPEGRWCTCPSMGEYILPNGPVQVDANGLLTGSGCGVMVDGAMLSSTSYRVYDNRRLVRQIDPYTNSAPIWYCHQWLTLPLSQQGTWAVTYQHGIAPPMSGWLAAREVAVDMAISIGGGQSRIPANTKQITRNNVQVTVVNTADALKEGKTGIPLVDQFIHAYNPNGQRQRARIWTPHLPSGANQ